MQQKRVFNEYSCFSYPRLKARLQAFFKERKQKVLWCCCCAAVVSKADLGATAGRTHPLPAPPGALPVVLPSLSTPPSMTASPNDRPECHWRLSMTNLHLKRLFRLKLQLLKSLSSDSKSLNCYHCAVSCLLPPGPQRHFLSKGIKSWLCSYTSTLLRCTLHSQWCIWSRPSPLFPLHFYLVPHLVEIWWYILCEPFPRDNSLIGRLYKGTRRTSSRFTLHC